MNNASHLLSRACAAFKDAAQALNGPLERDVESSAARCWDLRERSVQIKGRFMRTKTLIIEDPIFIDDEERAFGDTLANWEDLGAGGVAAAALEGKIAEQRLLHATRKTLSQQPSSPESILDALDSVLTLYEEVQKLENTLSADTIEKEFLSNSLQFIQQITFQLSHGYLSAVGSSSTDATVDSSSSNSTTPAPRPSSQAVASLASILAQHGPSIDWTIGFLQPQPQDILPTLLTLTAEKERKNIVYHPVAVVRILGQFGISSPAVISQLTASKEAYLLPQALVDMVEPIEEIFLSLEGSGVAGATDAAGGNAVAVAAASEVCITVHRITLQLGAADQKNRSTEGDNTPSRSNRLAVSVAGALVELLLAASKGISTTALRAHFNSQLESRNALNTNTTGAGAGSTIESISISELADWIFSFRPRSKVNQNLILGLLSGLDWEWFAVHCPCRLRLKWLLAVVAAVKALHEGENRNAAAAAAARAVHALSEMLSGTRGWNFITESFQGDIDTPTRAAEGQEQEEGRMLCLLEAPATEPAAVLLLWRQIQATVALSLCTTWINQSNREIDVPSQSIKEDISALLESARVADALTQMVQSMQSMAALSILSHVVHSTASAPEFLSTLYPTLSLTLSAALALEANNTSASVFNVFEKAIGEAALKTSDRSTEQKEGVEVDNSPSFAFLVAWLGLFVGSIAQRDGLSSTISHPAVVPLFAKLIRTVYIRLGRTTNPVESKKLALLLLHLATALRDQPVSQTQQLLVAQLLSGSLGGGSGGGCGEDLAWMRVLGAWIADAVCLSNKMPHQGINSWSLHDAEGVLLKTTVVVEAGEASETGVESQSSFSFPSPEEAEAAANEVFLLQEAIQSTLQSSTDPVPSLILCYELSWRILSNYGALSPLLDRQQLTTTITSISQQIHSTSLEIAESVMSLLAMLENEGQSTATVLHVLPFIGSFSLVEKISSTALAATWLEKDWKASSPSASPSTGVVDSLSRDFETSVSLGEGSHSAVSAVQLPPPESVPPSSSLDFLAHQQEEQAFSLATAQEELRYWVRQGEKAAARPEGEEPAPEQGKEGDIPAPLATAQRHLWELEQRQHEELSHVHAALRQKVCQQYNPIDEQFLQEASEAFSDGDRIPRAMLLRDSQHSAQCRELRKQAFTVALSIHSAKELSLAAKELFTFEYLLLEAVEKGEAVQERDAIRSKLLAVMAHSIVNGSTPVSGIPYMVGLFERAVTGGGIILDTDAKLRLIPRIAANLMSSSASSSNAHIGGASSFSAGGASGAPVLGVLRKREGMRLLNACLDPDALLNAGKLREFMTALQLVARLTFNGNGGGGGGDVVINSSSTSGQPSVMLSSFDAQRFAVLVAEKPGSVRGASGSSTQGGAAGGSSSSGGSGSGSGSASAASSLRNKSKEVGVDEILNLAAECLFHPSSASTGAALLEGMLNISPAPLYAACLGVVLNAPATGRRDTLLSMLSQVPMEILEPPIIAESISLLIQSLDTGKLDPPDLPYGLLSALLRAVPVLESLRIGLENSKAVQRAASQGGKKISTSKNGNTSTTVKLDNYTMKKPAWTISTNVISSAAGGSGGGGSGGSSAAAGNGTAAVMPSITLHQISSSYIPLGTLAENSLQSAMNAVLRMLRNSGSVGAGSGDFVQPLFGIVFELAGVCGLELVWQFYQTHLCAFIADADKASTAGTACAAAFQQYWASLPWSQATFHFESPLEIAKIRKYLPSADYAAARLVHDLDWTPVLASILPEALHHPRIETTSGSGVGSEAAAVGGTSTSSAPGVFTLLDEAEDDNALINTASTTSLIDISNYSRKHWAAELGLLLLHCSIYLPDSSIGIPEWAQRLLLGITNTSGSGGGTGATEQAEIERESEKSLGIENQEEDVGIIRLLAAADWHVIESSILPSSTYSNTSIDASSQFMSEFSVKAPWLVLPLLLAPGSIHGDVGERVVHAAYVLSRAAEKESSACAARVVAKAVRPLLALSICQGIQISMDAQMHAVAAAGGGGRSGGGVGRGGLEEAATAAALAASIASHQLVDIPDDIPEELLEGTVELEQLRLQREQIRLAQEEVAAAAAAAAAAAGSAALNNQSGVSPTFSSGSSAVPLIEVTGCFRFTPAQHVTLLRDVLGPLAAKHAQQPLNIASITADQCAPDLEPPSHDDAETTSGVNDATGGVVMWNLPSLAAFISTLNTATIEEQNNESRGTLDAAAVAALLCVTLLQPLVFDPLTIITQDPLSYTNAELPWVIENTSKAIFITANNASVSGGGGGSSRQRPGGRSMRALRQQISSILRGRDADSNSSFLSTQGDSLADPDRALNLAVTDALSLRNLMGHVIEDAAVRAMYSVQHGKRLGACLLRCILLTASVYYSAFVAHVAENVLRGMAAAPSSSVLSSSTTNTNRLVPPIGSSYGHASEEVPVIEATTEHGNVTSSTNPIPSSSTDFATSTSTAAELAGNVVVPESMHFAAVAASNLEPAYLLQFAQAAARMRRPLLTAFALASARHAATILDKISWQGLVIEALKVVQQSESNAEHPLDVIAPWLESLKWIGDSRWRRLPSGPHKVALNDLLSSLDNRVQVIEVLTPEEVGEGISIGGISPQKRRNPLSAAANAASIAAGRVRHQLGQATGVPAGVPAPISELSSEQQPATSSSPGGSSTSSTPSQQQQQQQQHQFASSGPEEDPSLSKKFASGFRSLGKSVSQAKNKLKNKLGDGPPPSTTPSASAAASGSTLYPSAPASQSAQYPSAPPAASTQFREEYIGSERDHLVRVGLAAYAITSYIRCVMDPQLTRRTISGVSLEPSSPKHLRASSTTMTPSSVHIRGNSSLTGSRHLEEAQISELDTVLEAREAVDFLTELESSPLLAHHRHVYAAFLDRVPQLLTAMIGVQTFVVAVVRLLVPVEDEAGQIVAVLSHSGA